MDKGLLQRRVSLIIIIAMLVVILGMIVIGCSTASSESEDIKTNSLMYTGEWTKVNGNNRTEVQLPGRIEGIEAGETLVLETTLPMSVSDGDYFVLYIDHQDARVCVGALVRSIYTTRTYSLAGNNSASSYLFVPLASTDKGMVLQVTLISHASSYTGSVPEIYLGEKNDIWLYLINRNWLQIGVSIYAFLLGIILFVVNILISRYYKANNGLLYLSVNIIIVGVCLLFTCKVRQLFFPVFSILEIATILLFIVSDIVLNFYVCEMFGESTRQFYEIITAILFFDFAVTLFLHVTKILDVQASRTFSLGLCIITRIALLFIIRIRVFIDKKREHFYTGAGVCIYILFSVIAHYYNYKGFEYSALIVLAMGITLNFVGVVLMIANVYSKSESDKKNAIIEAQARTMFLATMSHDIRTPINTVLGMNEMILRENREPQIAEYSRDIQRAGKMLLNLVNDILDFSKIDSGKLELVIDDYKVGLVISDLLNLIDERAREKHLEVICNVDPTIPAELRGDEMRVKQIVMNLLTNAVKYTERGSVTMNVTGGFAQNRKYVLRFDVIDTGQGIKKENLDKLFLNYTRLEEKSNKGIEGTGLGLGITKNLLNIMGGSITVSSEFGLGSTFTVFIPQESLSKDTIGDFNSSKLGETYTTERKIFHAPDAHVLVVDDNRMNLNVIKGLLKETQIQLDLARSGQECLDLCGRLEYDLILMDHMMPEMDGIETLHRLNEAWNCADNGGMVCRRVPVIILTANAISGMKDMYLKQGFTDYLSKPVDPIKLEEMVLNYLPKEKVDL